MLHSVVSQWFTNFTGCLIKREIFRIQFRTREQPFLPMKGSLTQMMGMMGSVTFSLCSFRNSGGVDIY